MYDTAGHHYKIVKSNCEYYGIPISENSSITRARLVLHISGITKEYVGEDKLEECVQQLALFLKYVVWQTLVYQNKIGHEIFPAGWITCTRRTEALLQVVVRILDSRGINYPAVTRSTVFHGIEPPCNPSFELIGCFEHFLTAPKKKKHGRWVYIAKALEVYGVYPIHGLYRNLADALAKAFDPELPDSRHSMKPQVSGGHGTKGVDWKRIRVLQRLGIGLKLDRDAQNRSTDRGVLLPWGIRTAPPYNLDWYIGFWIGVSQPRGPPSEYHTDRRYSICFAWPISKRKSGLCSGLCPTPQPSEVQAARLRLLASPSRAFCLLASE